METHAELAVTPLIDIHKELGAKLAPFGGWLMPIQYRGILEEHHWTRAHTGIFDICHMGEFLITASLTQSTLNSLFTVDLTTVSVGECRYGFMLTPKGGVVDDLIIYRLEAERWMVVVNAACIAKDEAHLRAHLKGARALENVSARTGKLDLQGPSSSQVLSKLAGVKIAGLRYFTFGRFKVLGEDMLVSRTGYTGELGYELYGPAEKMTELWRELCKDPEVRPIGLGARDTLRLEMGYNLYGQDITEETTPLECDGAHFIDWGKEFIGKESLRAQERKRSARARVYFAADSRRAPRHNFRIIYKDKDIGIVTSGVFSPSLGYGIGMGMVSAAPAKGEPVVLTEGAVGVAIPGKIVSKPFYRAGSAKRKEILHADS
jgi:aminomethyltransferase